MGRAENQLGLQSGAGTFLKRRDPRPVGGAEVFADL